MPGEFFTIRRLFAIYHNPQTHLALWGVIWVPPKSRSETSCCSDPNHQRGVLWARGSVTHSK